VGAVRKSPFSEVKMSYEFKGSKNCERLSTRNRGEALLFALFTSGLALCPLLWFLRRHRRRSPPSVPCSLLQVPVAPVTPGEVAGDQRHLGPVEITIYRTDIVARLLRDRLRVNTPVRMYLLLLGLELVMVYGLSYLTGTFWPKPDLAIAAAEDVLVALGTFLLLPLASSYYIGQLTHYPRTLNDLYLDGAMDLTQSEFESFMRRLERAYNWRGWYVIALISIVLTFSSWIPNQLRLPPYWYTSPFPWVCLRVPYNCFSWYVLMMISFRHTVTWLALLRLITRRRLVIRPLHPDGCGGMEPLGRLPLYALPAAASIAVYLVTLVVRQRLLGDPLIHFDLAIAWVYYLIFVGATILMPMLPVHWSMEEARYRFVRKMLVRAQPLMDDIDTKLGSSNGPFMITDELDQLREMESVMRSLPRWPLRPRDSYSAAFSVFVPLLFGVVSETVAVLLANWLI
jgi:hypothetical protein